MYSEKFELVEAGVAVFGSSSIRVVPDIAVVDFAIVRCAPTARQAMLDVADAAKGLRTHLAHRGLNEVSIADTELEQRFAHYDKDEESEGYRARIRFSLLLRELAQAQDIVTSLVEAGANVLRSVDRQTSRIKSIRAEARARAVQAAREKAEEYCHSAQVTLGRVLSIADLDPNSLRFSSSGHVVVEHRSDDEVEPSTNDPGTIVVNAAVRMVYAIGSPCPDD